MAHAAGRGRGRADAARRGAAGGAGERRWRVLRRPCPGASTETATEGEGGETVGARLVELRMLAALLSALA